MKGDLYYVFKPEEQEILCIFTHGYFQGIFGKILEKAEGLESHTNEVYLHYKNNYYLVPLALVKKL